MDYFFSRLGRSLRYTSTIIGSLACGAIIIMGAIGIQTIFIPVCGGIALIPMAMVLFESAKVLRDLEKLVTQFKNQLNQLGIINTSLSKNVSDLTITKDALIKETTKLSTLLQEAEVNIIKLSALAKTYEDNANQLSQLTQDYKNQNEQLTEETNKLVNIKQEYEKENHKLTSTIEQITQQLDILVELKETREQELLTTKENNEELKIEIQKIALYYNQAKEVIETLLRSRNVLDDIYNGMIKTETQTAENVNTMSKLLNIFGTERTMELFQQLDEDKDGVLTSQEFINALSKKNNEIH